MRKSCNLIIAAMAALLPFSTPARADWQLAPKNSHALYQSYALFNEPQSALLFRSAGREWGSLGGTFAIVGDPDTAAHPQFVLGASMQTAILDRFAMDSLNARMSAAYEFTVNPLMRLSLGALYSSGHIVDGAIEFDFTSVEAHDTRLFARFVYDVGPYLRAGATIAPILGSSVAMEVFSAQQFIEAHPWGGTDDAKSPSPYLAIALEQEGTHAFGLKNTFHAQVGVYFGNHFSNDPKPTFRPVLGFYTGADPRLAYFRIAGKNTSFVYAGLMFDF